MRTGKENSKSRSPEACHTCKEREFLMKLGAALRDRPDELVLYPNVQLAVITLNEAIDSRIRAIGTKPEASVSQPAPAADNAEDSEDEVSRLRFSLSQTALADHPSTSGVQPAQYGPPGSPAHKSERQVVVDQPYYVAPTRRVVDGVVYEAGSLQELAFTTTGVQAESHPPSPDHRSPSKSKYVCYAIIVGKRVGVFTNWTIAQNYVNGVPRASFKGYRTIEEAKRAFRQALARNLVKIMTT
ncbi:hypothetical protein DFH11DRAFT_1548074 [Phellopilus nigrolimitatus]|nr:hypothetical protein DFH11DRAFT_1548074 [Phellopilus nigrolimitatus]